MYSCQIFFHLLTILTITFDYIYSQNVLLMLADDFGLQSSLYETTVCQTPYINRLASKSTLFENAYSSVSSCSPSRASLLTGLPSHQNGIYGLHHNVHHFQAFDAVQSLSKILRKSNIYTGIIGKEHVGPSSVFPFDFRYTEKDYPILQVGRNITRIKLLTRQFLINAQKRKQFFLYIGFHDPHRCGHTHPQYGYFCEKFGSGQPETGYIPDWKPVYYNITDIQVPFYIPDTDVTRKELSAQYTTISRMDQGIGLIMNELKTLGFLNNTLVIFTSDNGPPFPNGRTNVYEPGIREPLIIYNPLRRQTKMKRVKVRVSHLDVAPTILDWFGIKSPTYKIFNQNAEMTGVSLLKYTLDDDASLPIQQDDNAIYGSHNLHEITMYYPIRYLLWGDYKLIHNINFYSPFPIDQDFYLSDTFQEILVRTAKGKPLGWNKNLTTYYHRDEWELFDLKTDPQELNNLYFNKSMQKTFQSMKNKLYDWQNKTHDPWICSPHSVLEVNLKSESNKVVCMPLLN